MSKTLRLFLSMLASNIGIACMSYAGYRMGWWGNDTMWKVMFADGLYFCLGSLINAASVAAHEY